MNVKLLKLILLIALVLALTACSEKETTKTETPVVTSEQTKPPTSTSMPTSSPTPTIEPLEESPKEWFLWGDGETITGLTEEGIEQSEYVLPSDCRVVAECAFDRKINVKKIDLNRVEIIGAGAFNGCANLETAILRCVIDIQEGAFIGCDAMTSITLPRSLERIGSNAFLYSSGVREILFEDAEYSDLTIGEQAFMCSGIRKMTLPSGTKTIGENAFLDTELEELYLPTGINIFGMQGFYEEATALTIYLKEDHVWGSYMSMEDVQFEETALQRFNIAESLGYFHVKTY